MKRILILIIGLFGVAQAQFSTTSAKTAFKNGVSVGTRDSTAYNAADSLVVVINRQGRLMYRSTDGYWKLLANAASSDYVPYTGAVDNVALGNFRLTARSLKTDSIYANSSAGMYLTTNTGTAVAHWGSGGSVEVDFKGFAGYDANRSASYTARSFTDKNYVDSSDALRVRYTDTAAMLAPFVQYSDTTGLYSQVVRTFGTQTVNGIKTFSNNVFSNGYYYSRGALDQGLYVQNAVGGQNGFFGFRATSGTIGVIITNNSNDEILLPESGGFQYNVSNVNRFTVSQSGNGFFSGQLNANSFIISNQEVVTKKNSAAGGGAWFGMKNAAGTNRWNIGADVAETGSGNTGFDFNLYRYDDAGNNLGAAIRIVRSTGNTTLSGSLSGTTANFASSVTGSSYSVIGTNGYSGQIIQQGELLGGTGTNLLIQASTGNSIGFLTNGASTISMFINTIGNVGVGTTIPNSNADRTLHLHNTSTGSTYFKVTNSTTGAGINDGLDFGEINSNTYVINRENGFMSFWTNDTERLNIASTGAATFSSSVTATGFIVSSDLRYKNILLQDGDLYAYTLKNDETNRVHYGYIAQEIEKTLPNVVTTNADGYKAVNYTEVHAVKIRELEKRIEQLEKLLNR